MRDITVKGFKDEYVNHLYGRSLLRPFHRGDLSEALLSTIPGIEKRMLERAEIARTMYIPPMHLKMYNGTKDVLLMPWLNIINGIYDNKNLPWMQNVYSSTFESKAITTNLAVFLLKTVNRLSRLHTTISDISKEQVFNDITSWVNHEGLPSFAASSLLFYNPFIHGRMMFKYEYLHNIKEIAHLNFSMGGRKIDTMYRSIRTETNHILQFYNSLEMFVTTYANEYVYNKSRGPHGRNQSNFETYSEAQHRFIELGEACRNSRSQSVTGIRITDEFPIIPIILPVIEIRALREWLESLFSEGGVIKKRLPIINRDSIKFLVYNDVLDETLAYTGKSPSILRLEAVMLKNLRKLKSAGCCIKYVSSKYSANSKGYYKGGLASISPLPTSLKDENGAIQTSIRLNGVVHKHLHKISKEGDKNFTQFEILEWLLKFGTNHVPLIKHI